MRSVSVLKPKYSAIPPHTPVITRSFFDLYNVVSIHSPPNDLNLLVLYQIFLDGYR